MIFGKREKGNEEKKGQTQSKDPPQFRIRLSDKYKVRNDQVVGNNASEFRKAARKFIE